MQYWIYINFYVVSYLLDVHIFYLKQKLQSGEQILLLMYFLLWAYAHSIVRFYVVWNLKNENSADIKSLQILYEIKSGEQCRILLTFINTSKFNHVETYHWFAFMQRYPFQMMGNYMTRVHFKPMIWFVWIARMLKKGTSIIHFMCQSQ